MTSRSFTGFAVALPLLAIAFGILRAELFLADARDFAFEIQGYDPRDLLRGRYLQFQLRIAMDLEREPCDDSVGPCCLCLTRVPEQDVPRAERATCATARQSCDGALALRYSFEPLRYYVPEERAAELEERLTKARQERSARAILALDALGNAEVRELRIDGVPILARP